MELAYDKDVFIVKCKFHENHFLEDLDKRWSKAKKHWRVYDADLNKRILKDIASKTRVVMSDEAKQKLNKTSVLKAEEPVTYVYKTDPLPFQIPATKFLLSVNYGALFAPVGSGKSKILIDVMQSLFMAGEISRVVIVGLVSIVDNWKDQIETHWKGEVPWEMFLITGVESYSQGNLYKMVKDVVTDTTLMLVDEGQKIKNPKSIRTSRIIELGEKAKKKYIMTGTPILNGNSDIFSQYLFLHPDIIGIKTFIGFRNRYCVMGGYENKKIIGYKNQEELMEKLKPYSFVIDKKEAMPFLPSQTFMIRKVKKTKEQERLITKLREELLSETLLGDKTVTNILTVMLRISQITGGFHEEGRHIDGPNPKLKELKDIIEESPDEQMVIFCRFLPEIHMLMEELPNSAGIYGAIKAQERNEIRKEFQAGKHKYLICQYQSGAVGLDMYAARICVFFSFDFSLEMWLQSIGRIARIQQKRPMIYYPLLMAGTADYLIYRALGEKQEIADYVKEKLKEGGLALLYDEITKEEM